MHWQWLNYCLSQKDQYDNDEKYDEYEYDEDQTTDE